MKNEWHKLLNNKNFPYYSLSKKLSLNNRYQKLCFLLAYIIYPNLTSKNYFKIIKYIEKNLKLKKHTSILDFGSGNGAFLNFFVKKYSLKNNLSLEVSSPLINFQKTFIKKTKFQKTDHIKTTYLNKFKNNSFEYSFSSSVFQYFINEKYALTILNFLIRTTKKNILIFDIKNFDKKKLYNETVRKRQGLSIKEFKKKYSNTPIRFYKKQFFANFLEKYKKKYNISYKFKALPPETVDHTYGFSLIIFKK